MKSGVVLLVILSVFELPVSLAAVMSGVPGAAGAVVSIVIPRPVDATDWLPAVSVCLAIIVCAPSERVEEVSVTGLEEQEAESSCVAPSYN